MHLIASCNGLTSTTLCDHERKKGGKAAKWANSLSRWHNLALFFSPSTRYILVRLPRLPYRSILHTHSPSLSRTVGQIHFVFIKFHKASRQTTRLYFPFSRPTGIAQKGSVAENGERGVRGEGDDYHVRPLVFSFFLRRSLIPVIFLVTYISVGASVCLFLSLPASQRELGVTIQSTCFTFKSPLAVPAISDRRMARARHCVCVYVHHATQDLQLSTEGPARCRPALLPVGPPQDESRAEWFRSFRTKWILH